MKIALFSGAVKNAGDFLITERTESLLRAFIPDASITRYIRNTAQDAHLEDINSNDIAVFAGGPGFVYDIYPSRMPLVKDLADITIPIREIGMGCYSHDGTVDAIPFTTDSLELLCRFEDAGRLPLSCRDDLSRSILVESGFDDVWMTGCPAWYDIDFIKMNSELIPTPPDNIKRIAISDPGRIANFNTLKQLLESIFRIYGNPEITVVFHKGWKDDANASKVMVSEQRKLIGWIRKHYPDVRFSDISYGTEGFAVYDECDMHIGFRVHAHIYSLSHRKPSFLIEEDGRGFGLNDTLDMTHFPISRKSTFKKALLKATGSTGRADRDIALSIVSHSYDQASMGFPEVSRAIGIMNSSFEKMTDYLRIARGS